MEFFIQSTLINIRAIKKRYFDSLAMHNKSNLSSNPQEIK